MPAHAAIPAWHGGIDDEIGSRVPCRAIYRPRCHASPACTQDHHPRHHYGSRSVQAYRCTPPPAFPLCVVYVRAPTKLRGQRMHGRDLSIDTRPHEKHPRDAPSNGHAIPFPDPIFLSSVFATRVPLPEQESFSGWERGRGIGFSWKWLGIFIGASDEIFRRVSIELWDRGKFRE